VATDPGARLYEQFAPPERLTLMLSALARGDQAEACRLRDTCPRKMYTQSDDAFEGRLQLAFDTMAVIFIDVMCLWGKLKVLRWVTDAARDFAPAGVIGASLSFIDGWRFGQGRPQTPFFARKLPPLTLEDGGEHYAIHTGEHQDDDYEDEDEEPDEGHAADDAAVREQVVPRHRTGEFRRRVEAVEARAQRAASLLTLSLAAAERDVAKELATIWAAFGRFRRTRLGVGPVEMLVAWEFPFAAELEETLERYADVTPDPAAVDEYAGHILAHWDGKFGGGGHDGGR
jgi:hypothetical protein